ncbi:imidazole glycerol phosphate synthase subunit HisH [Candidatus Manganitrophus noduliformans]|nr:imidazole glycerol phosphate synthase subunit HisH [Candidatus Manganitrophus noduliformans]
MAHRKIVIVDYGMGNVGSIQNMLKHLGVESVISSQISEIQSADKLILSGVGAFDTAVKNIHERNLLPALNHRVLKEKKPVLGICLGMQLLTQRSEEGKLAGLGWIEGETIRFKLDGSQKLKVPHMGWNPVAVQKESPLFQEMPAEPRFYFVHSYHVVCKKEDALCTTHHGYDFVSAVEKENIYGTQFHPEKSHKFGLQLLKNFAERV